MANRPEQITFTHTFARRQSPACTEIVVNAPAGARVTTKVTAADGHQTAQEEVEAAGSDDGESCARFQFDGLQALCTLVVEIDGEGVGSHTVPAVPFDVKRLLASGTGAPFDRFGFGGRLDFTGPFLGFSAQRVSCADAHVVVHNRASDERYWADVDAEGNLALELSDTYPGDVLDVWAEDFSGQRSPEQVMGFVVPNAPSVSKAMRGALEKEDVALIVDALANEPNAAHRFVWEAFASSFGDDEHTKLRARADALFANANQVLLHTSPRTSS